MRAGAAMLPPVFDAALPVQVPVRGAYQPSRSRSENQVMAVTSKGQRSA